MPYAFRLVKAFPVGNGGVSGKTAVSQRARILRKARKIPNDGKKP